MGFLKFTDVILKYASFLRELRSEDLRLASFHLCAHTHNLHVRVYDSGRQAGSNIMVWWFASSSLPWPRDKSFKGSWRESSFSAASPVLAPTHYLPSSIFLVHN